MNESIEKQIVRHPIQIVELKVNKLSIEVNENVDQDVKVEPNISAKFYHAYTGFNAENKSIAVKVGVKIDSDDVPYKLLVEIVGFFTVNAEAYSDRFSEKHIIPWAKQASMFVLYPYLREHVLGLTSRAGFDGLLLPLLEVPMIVASD